ncbi:uncharacterized protein METZ01_LOCUS121512, partial [marine metagenome]
MIFEFGVRFLEIPRLLIIVIIWVFSGCATSNENPHLSRYESDGYYEALPSLGKKGYLIKQLAPEVYFFSTGVYNNLFIVTPDGVVITDPIKGKGKLLKKAIAEVTSQPVRFMIYSHSHIDHIGDAYLFSGEGVEIIAQVETGKSLKKYRDKKRPLPHINFGTNYSLS